MNPAEPVTTYLIGVRVAKLQPYGSLHLGIVGAPRPPASGAGAIDLRFRDLRVFNRDRPALPPGQPQLAHDRQERDRHDREDGELEVLLDHVDLAEEVAEQRDADRPQEATDHVE